MSQPKLTIYTISISPKNNDVIKTNRWLMRNLINEANANQLEDSYIFAEFFRAFIARIDTPEMIKDNKSKKTITANQLNIEDPDVEPNIKIGSDNFIIYGIIEGGTYGRRRKKTSTQNKVNKTDVSDLDAITDDFYFLIHIPPAEDKVVLMLHSYFGETIDAVMKDFWEKFFSITGVFNKPKIKRFVPKSIIDDFKNNSVVSQLKYSAEVPGETLMDSTFTSTDRNFKVTITVEPIGDGLTLEEFEAARTAGQTQGFLSRIRRMIHPNRNNALLKDVTTSKSSSFELNSDLDIEPVVVLSKYIQVSEEGVFNFDTLHQFCLQLLENEITEQVYNNNAITEH